jgi:hypothetical protein
MIDDSYSKMREFPENVYIVPEYTEEFISAGMDCNDDALQNTKAFIDELLSEWTGNFRMTDVRVAIKDLKRKFM